MGGAPIAILASGDGTTAEALMRACANGDVDCDVGLVVTNNRSAGVLERVARVNSECRSSVATALVNRETHPPATGEELRPGGQTIAEEAAIATLLTEGGFGLVVLMGYMKRVGAGLVREFGWQPEYKSPYQARLLNIHPGLLPETKGLFGIAVQEHVLDKKLRAAGHVVHVVSDNYDEGPIVSEHRTKVLGSDTPVTLSGRIKALQRQDVPQDIAEFLIVQQRYRSSLLAAAPLGGGQDK
jgi:phosphoribosylglycinamide formyltransferase-1